MSNRTNARAAAERGARLTKEDALALYEDNDLLALAAWARAAKERASGKNVYYTVNRHINLTNICSANCPLCAFQVEQGDARGYIMETDDVARVLELAKKTPRLTEIHIVSALHPDRPFSYYEGVVRQVRAALPHADIKAFTPVEVVNFAKTEGASVRDILSRLQSVGLSSLPGGGAGALDRAPANTSGRAKDPLTSTNERHRVMPGNGEFVLAECQSADPRSHLVRRGFLRFTRLIRSGRAHRLHR